MAHTCPNCQNICYCSGDIDDINFGEAWYCKCDCCEDECDEDYYSDDDNFKEKQQ